MKPNRKYVRSWIDGATRSELDLVVSEANLTDKQIRILNQTIHTEQTQYDIAEDEMCDVSCIKRQIAKVYDKIYKVLLDHFTTLS